MFLRFVLGGVVWLFCVPIYAQTSPQMALAKAKVATDPKTVWGQDTDQTIAAIERRLHRLQAQSVFVDEVDNFDESTPHHSVAYLSDESNVLPEKMTNNAIFEPKTDAHIVTDVGTAQHIDTPQIDTPQEDFGVDPAMYLPAMDRTQRLDVPKPYVDDTLQKPTTLFNRLYSRVFDGATVSYLQARIFVNELAHKPSTPTTDAPPNTTQASLDADESQAILVNINRPDWQASDEIDLPKQFKAANTQHEPFKNIQSAIQTISTDSTPSFVASLPRLRQVVNDASRAVGYYEIDFDINHAGKGVVDVIINRLGQPVTIASQTVQIRGPMNDLPEREQLAKTTPKLDEVFHHGEYERTKNQIETLSVQKGFFDGNWLEHSADVLLPDNRADVNLIYESGERYVFDKVVFFTLDKATGQLTTDPNKLPIKPSLLKQLLTFEANEGFESKKVAQLSSQLLATRYFNNANVETVLPHTDEGSGVIFENESTVASNDQQVSATINPIEFDVSDSLLAKLQEVSNKANRLHDSPDDRVLEPNPKRTTSLLAQLSEGIKTLAHAILPDESADDKVNFLSEAARFGLPGRKSPAQVFKDKKIPLYVFVSSDKPKDAQIGLGWGSDTGMRAMMRLENNLVNKDGYQAGVEGSISKDNQAIEFYVSRPLSHPTDDKLIAHTSYTQDKIAQSVQNVQILSRSIESGLSRNIIRPSDNRSYFVKYRLDGLKTTAPKSLWENLPIQFQTGSATQQALLVGANFSKTQSDNLTAPTKGYRHYYGLELGSRQLVNDTDMAIIKAGASGMNSFGNNAYGKNRSHQLIGRLDLGYIWASDFERVPYKLKFFAGGDQSVRGYDYQSLSPKNAKGYLVGGQALATASLEYNYEFKEGFRAAVFADVGGAYDRQFSRAALGESTKLGAGVGLRFASPVGTVRVDIAKGIEGTKTPIRLHFLIGKPF